MSLGRHLSGAGFSINPTYPLHKFRHHTPEVVTNVVTQENGHRVEVFFFFKKKVIKAP